VDGAKAEQLSVVAGTNDLSNNSYGSRHEVEWFKIHEEYVELNRCDIAIMKMKQQFKFDEKISAIKFSNNFVDGGETCVLTGWGFTFPVRVGSTPKKLQRAELSTITNEDCKSRGLPVNPTEICTFTRFGQGACGVSD
jgi:secreted trypsin-like serine protease